MGTTLTGFHDGELAVQDRAGVRAEAARLTPMLAPGDLTGGAALFLAARRMAFLTARDSGGRLWTSPLVGRPGFLEGDGTTLRVHVAPAGPDPLVALPAGQPVGLLAIDLATRRRFRVNGTLVASSPGELGIEVDQAFGNCPKYIHPRSVVPLPAAGGTSPTLAAPGTRTTSLSPQQRQMIRRADTFFLGTTHPERGSDASHRGGAPGFVRIERAPLAPVAPAVTVIGVPGAAVHRHPGSNAREREQLWWPDYPGNNMFNSFGNIAVDDRAAMLFIDFETGGTLHLSGRAVLDWLPPNTPGDDAGTGRRVRFTVESVTEGARLGFG